MYVILWDLLVEEDLRDNSLGKGKIILDLIKKMKDQLINVLRSCSDDRRELSLLVKEDTLVDLDSC